MTPWGNVTTLSFNRRSRNTLLISVEDFLTPSDTAEEGTGPYCGLPPSLSTPHTPSIKSSLSAALLLKLLSVFLLCRKVWKMTFRKVPSAGGMILQLPTAHTSPRKLYRNPSQNLATEQKKRSVWFCHSFPIKLSHKSTFQN